MSGQTGITVREALVRGDWRVAAEGVPDLDEPHRIEILLGAALRDAREGFARALAFPEVTDWAAYCRWLVDGTPATHLDDLAAAYVAERRVPDVWRPYGTSLGVALADDLDAAAAYAAGVGGLEIVNAFRARPLWPAVSVYYRRGTIWALGPRPMLVLAASG